MNISFHQSSKSFSIDVLDGSSGKIRILLSIPDKLSLSQMSESLDEELAFNHLIYLL